MRGESTARIVSAIIIWVAGALLVGGIISWNVDTTKTVNISGIKSDKIIAGYNATDNVEEVTPMNFTGRSYDLVMVVFARGDVGEITYIGLSDGKYYRSTETILLGALQRVGSTKIGTDGKSLIINCVKNTTEVILFSFVFLIFFGLLGFLITPWLKYILYG